MAGYYAELNVYLNSGKEPLTEEQKLQKKQKQQIEKTKKTAAKVTGTTLAVAAYANSKVGQYTGNKMRQANNQTTLALTGMGLLALKNPVVGITALATYVTKSAIDTQINIINSQQESAYRMSYKGNMTTSGSRWRGSKK